MWQLVCGHRGKHLEVRPSCADEDDNCKEKDATNEGEKIEEV